MYVYMYRLLIKASGNLVFSSSFFVSTGKIFKVNNYDINDLKRSSFAVPFSLLQLPIASVLVQS